MFWLLLRVTLVLVFALTGQTPIDEDMLDDVRRLGGANRIGWAYRNG